MNYALWRTYWQRAYRTAWVLRFVPFVRLVGLNGSMVTGKVHEGSDIDFYIVVEPGHIFLTRILTTVVTHLLGVRRHGIHIVGRVCLNRYATTDFTQITPNDMYHARVFHNLIPLAGSALVYKAYVRHNAWMAQFGYPIKVHAVPVSLPKAQRLSEWLLQPIATRLESGAEAWQKSRAKQDHRVRLPKSVVILTNQELRFHLQKD